jgi:hypothetical protein
VTVDGWDRFFAALDRDWRWFCRGAALALVAVGFFAGRFCWCRLGEVVSVLEAF